MRKRIIAAAFASALLVCLAAMAGEALRFDFPDDDALLDWKSNRIQAHAREGVLHLAGDNPDSKVWRPVTLAPGAYRLAAVGRGRGLRVALAEGWNRPFFLLRLDDGDADAWREREQPFVVDKAGTYLLLVFCAAPERVTAELRHIVITPEAVDTPDGRGAAEAALRAPPDGRAALDILHRHALADKKAKAEGTPPPLAEDGVSREAEAVAVLRAVYPVLYRPGKRPTGQLADWEAIPFADRLAMRNDGTGIPLEQPLDVRFKALVTDDTLFVLGLARDAHKTFGVKGPPYFNDCFELFFDPFFTRETRMRDANAQLFITAADADGREPILTGKYPATVLPVAVDGGWGFELALPLANDYFRAVPNNGLSIGFNISYCNNDGREKLSQKFTWSALDSDDASWHNPSVYGLLRVVRAAAAAPPAVAEGPLLQRNRAARAGGETLADFAPLARQRPVPAVARGFTGMLDPANSAQEAAWGANLVRLWFQDRRRGDWNERREAIAKLLGERLDSLRPHGMKAVITVNGFPTPTANQKPWDDPASEAAFVENWRWLAQRLAPWRDVIWGYDLLNEPLANAELPYAPAKWRPLAVKALRAIREVDPGTWIIYEPGPGGHWRGFEDLPPLPDEKVIYSLHFYEPGPFTHQGLQARQMLDPGLLAQVQADTRVEYPGRIGGLFWDRGEIERQLAPVIGFQEKFNVPIYVGEFSVIAWAPPDSAERYLRDCLAVFEKNGWSWSWHNWNGWAGWNPNVEEGVLAKDLETIADSRRERLLREALRKNRVDGKPGASAPEKTLPLAGPVPSPDSRTDGDAPALRFDFTGHDPLAGWKINLIETEILDGNAGVRLTGSDWDSKLHRAVTLPAGRYRLAGVGRGAGPRLALSRGWNAPFSQLNLGAPAEQWREDAREFQLDKTEALNLSVFSAGAPGGRYVSDLREITLTPAAEDAGAEEAASRPPVAATTPPLARGFTLQDHRHLAEAKNDWGADVVRKWIEARELRDEIGFDREMRRIARYLDEARRHGLAVVLTLNASAFAPDADTDHERNAFWSDPGLPGRAAAVWGRIAGALFEHRDAIYAYDLCNEPLDRDQMPNPPRQWRAAALAALAAIRAVDPSTWIMYEPGPGGSHEGFTDLRPLPDARVIYSFHYYTPHEFTHQGIHDIAGTDLARPYAERRIRHTETPEGLRRRLRPVTEFQRRFGVPVFVGEFSVVRWAPREDAENYLAALIAVFAENGWSWCYHGLRDHHAWSLVHSDRFEDHAPASRETGRAALLRKALRESRR